jgi:hypothetical protein
VAIVEATPLHPDEVACFWRDGFVAVQQFAPPAEVLALQDVYDELFARRAGREVGLQFDLAGADQDDVPAVLPQILLPSEQAPALRSTPIRRRALEIARQLLGDGAVDTGDHAINKPPTSPATTPWHQDEAYWNPAMDYRSISVWVPLQDVDVDNGCMQFLRGSNHGEVLPHQPIGGDVRVHGLELCAPPDPSSAVVCPLKAGGATVHFSRTVHFTGANTRQVPRRAYIMSFGIPPSPRAAPRTFAWLEQRQTARAQRAEGAGERREPGA